MTRWLPAALLAAALHGAPALEVRRETPSPNPRPTPEATAAATPAQHTIQPDQRPFTDDPEGAGINILDKPETLDRFTQLTIEFPAAMIGTEAVDQPAAESPVVFWPDLAVEFVWRSPSSGDLRVRGPLIPGQEYRLRLREGLANLAGEPLPQDAWGLRIETEPLRLLEPCGGEGETLDARPQTGLFFNYPIDLTSLTRGVWIQDRASRERFPVEVFLNMPTADVQPGEVAARDGGLPDTQAFARVRPVPALPANRTYDLVVDGVADAWAGRGLPYPRTIALGTTESLAVKFVAARAFPMQKPAIVAKFNQSLADGPLPEHAVTIQPPVEGVSIRKEADELIVEGPFQVPARYIVQLSEALAGVRGYTLGKAETWGATFREARPAVIFPGRTLRMRAAAGLHFAFTQAHTGALEWKLAAVPVAALAAVRERLDEYDGEVRDDDGKRARAADGFFAQPPTEPLVEALGLPVLASGTVPAASGEELRELAWRPDDPAKLGGPALLEVTGRDAAGRLVGNRALIYFADLAITRKWAPAAQIVRVAGLADGQPRGGARVALLDDAARTLAEASTDGEGLASFDPAVFAGCAFIVATEGETVAWQPRELEAQFPSGSPAYAQPPPRVRAFAFTDRPLYRPGQTVQFKGFVREEKSGGLSVPARSRIRWQVEVPYGSDVLASGEATLDAEGGWHGEWTSGTRVGEFVLRTLVDGSPAGAPARFQIEEFRNPPFSVLCAHEPSKAPATATIAVTSQLFHGAPNAGARVQWKAMWLDDPYGDFTEEEDRMVRVDRVSKNAREPEFSAEASGEAILDDDGRAVISVAAPYADPGHRARCRVGWRVDVTGADGQTVTGGTTQHVAMEPVLYGVRTVGSANGSLTFDWDALEPFGTAKPPVATLFHVNTVSVKERLAPAVYRYNNSDVFAEVGRLKLDQPGEFIMAAPKPGRYVIVIAPPGGAPGMPVGTETYVEGPGEASLRVESESAARILTMTGGWEPGGRAWDAGETAELHVLAPTAGIAWVTVETDTLLDTFTAPLEGNSARIEIPIKPHYEPNVFVTVYLLRPGGPQGLAGEMFGATRLDVRAPDRRLDVTVELAQSTVEPRERITGVVRVMATGQPVAGADLAIYAVDDAILTLGGWSLPEGFLRAFFPERRHAIATYSALDAFVDRVEPSWLTAKGFIVGDGGDADFGSNVFTRKEFLPLILWEPSVRTDANGVAAFSCNASDSLTRYRFIAVGQTRANQFGSGDAAVEVRKRLMIEPALPRFLREGDEVSLRAVVRQSEAAIAPVLTACTAVGAVALHGPAELRVDARRDAPAPVRFRARAGAPGNATIGFRAACATPAMADAVEVTLPVLDAVAIVRESASGTWEAATFDPAAAAPAAWKDREGTFTLSVSTSRHLPGLLGLRSLLGYPHGCFEQESSKLLAITQLANLFRSIPQEPGDGEAREAVAVEVLDALEAGMLEGGFLPYWPGGSEPNLFVTIQAAWGLFAAEAAGYDVPGRLAGQLPAALRTIASGRAPGSTPTLRAFALFVLTRKGTGEEGSIASDLALQRDRLSDEGRAMLAIALNALGQLPDIQRELLEGLPANRGDGDPKIFSSAARADALALWARSAVEGATPDTTQRLDAMLDETAERSTQENLWLLAATDALLRADARTKLRADALKPKPDAMAPDGSAARWAPSPSPTAATVAGLPRLRSPGSFVVEAVRRTRPDDPAVDNGLRIERVVKNLTDPARDGSRERAFRLGDEIAVSYRFASPKARHYLALVDPLPACLELRNPSLAQHGDALADTGGSSVLTPSFSDFRDSTATLYFDHAPSGAHAALVVGRVTAAGTFAWPAAQIYPMYDARAFGRSTATRLHVTE